MANLTLVRRDSYLENIKPQVKHDTLSALCNCLLNGYALFPDAVIRKAEDGITQYENNKRTSQPGPGQGGFAGGYKKQQQQNHFLILPVRNNHRTPPVPLGKLVRICLLGNHLVDGANPEDEALEVSPDAAPTLLKRPHNINDNYCTVNPVPVSQSVDCVKSIPN